MIEHDVTVTLTPEDIELYDRARAINLPTIVVSMYGDRIKMLLTQEREACAEICKKHADVYAKLEGNPTAKSAWAACIDNRDAILAKP